MLYNTDTMGICHSRGYGSTTGRIAYAFRGFGVAAALFMAAAGAPPIAAAPVLPAPRAEVLALAAGPEAPPAAELLAAAILFSGADAARAAAAEAVGLGAIAEAEALAASASGEYGLGAALLSAMHARLSDYRLTESRLDRALIEGQYNCVGSSTLYAILASAAGLRVRGVLLDDHAYCYLETAGGRVDVETTAAGGYDARKGDPPAGAADVSVRGVVALALRNRATMYERSGLWDAALALAVDAYAYAPDPSSFSTLLGRINNATAYRMRKGAYGEALDLAEAARSAYGPDRRLDDIRRAAALAAATEALRVADADEALAIADRAAADGVADEAWLERAYAFAYAGLAERLRAAGDHLGAWALASEAAERFPGNEAVASLERTARTNWARSEHNRFAALYNAGAYGEALAAVRAALALAPGEAMLLADEKAAVEAIGPGPRP